MRNAAFAILVFLNSSLSLAVAPSSRDRVQAKCEASAKNSAFDSISAEESPGGGLDQSAPATFIKLNRGGIFIFEAFVQKTFDYQVVVVVDKDCHPLSSLVTGP